jgi:hypothetical protein
MSASQSRWRVVGSALVVAALLAWGLTLTTQLILTRLVFPSVSRGPRPADGRPATAAAVTSDQLEEWLPPAPMDALAYDIRTPLFNGADVQLKQRWIWLPAGASIREVGSPESPRTLVPIGTKFWKDFYLHIDGVDHLVERRIIERVADPEGFHGWRFYKAHALPDAPSDDMRVSTIGVRAFFLAPDAWLPSQRVPRAITLDVQDGERHVAAYVFPGRTQCVTCHGGARGWYADGSDALAFGLTDLLRDPHARAELRARGWLTSNVEPSAPVEADDTAGVVEALRHNCLSCHNRSQTALARLTGFTLDPRQRYTTRELAAVLSRRGVMMDVQTRPIVTPGVPEESEIILRLRGLYGRRRMPPVEGGVATMDERLIGRMERWIRGLPSSP